MKKPAHSRHGISKVSRRRRERSERIRTRLAGFPSREWFQARLKDLEVVSDRYYNTLRFGKGGEILKASEENLRAELHRLRHHWGTDQPLEKELKGKVRRLEVRTGALEAAVQVELQGRTASPKCIFVDEEANKDDGASLFAVNR